MSYLTQASDWKVSGIGELSGGLGLTAGTWLFGFTSEAASYTAIFSFTGLGIGGGFGLKGVLKGVKKATKLLKLLRSIDNLPLSVGFPGANPIECATAFSMAELNFKPGLLVSGGISLLVGYQLMYISAYTRGKNYFVNQSCNGLQAGLGASVTNTAGSWLHIYGR